MTKQKRQPNQGDLLPPPNEKNPQSEIRNPKSDKRPYAPNPVVTEVPAICRRCGSTESRVTKTTQFYNRPLRVGGVTYPGRIVRRRTCAKCGLNFISNAPIEVNNPIP